MNDSPKAPSYETGAPVLSYQQQRNQFLLLILRGASLIGLFAIVPYILNPATAAVFKIAVAVGYVLLVLATFVPFPYPIRAAIPVAVAYVLGVIALFQSGIYGSACLYFLAFALLTAILYSSRGYIIALLIAVTTIAVLGGLILSGRVAITSKWVGGGNLTDWIIQTLIFILITTAFEEGWRRLSRDFNEAQGILQTTTNALHDEQMHLEDRVMERTAELTKSARLAQKQAESLRTVSELAQAIALIQDPQELLSAIPRLIGERFGLYHVGLFLIDDHNRYAVLQAANSEEGQQMLDTAYQVEIGQASIIGQVAATGEPRVVNRGGDELLQPDLPETQTQLTLPLIVRQRTIGVLDLHSTMEEAFGEQDLDAMRNLANQVTIAIENARLLNETRNALLEARTVYGQYMRQAWQQLPGTARMVGYRYTGTRVDKVERPLDLPEIQAVLQSGKVIAPPEEDTVIAVPLKLRDEIIGVLDIRSFSPQRSWGENEAALVQAVAERLALAIENARLFEETTRRADRERTVSEITSRIRSETDPQAMLQTALAELKRALGASEIRIRPYSPAEESQNATPPPLAKKKRGKSAEK